MLKKPLEMIAEWRKGCSCAGPEYDRMMGKPEGTTSATECVDCTEGLIDALEKVLREPSEEMLKLADDACLLDYRTGAAEEPIALRHLYRGMTGARDDTDRDVLGRMSNAAESLRPATFAKRPISELPDALKDGRPIMLWDHSGPFVVRWREGVGWDTGFASDTDGSPEVIEFATHFAEIEVPNG